MVNVIKCNKCAVDNCSMYHDNIDSSLCTSFKELDSFKVPMLIHLLTKEKCVPTVAALLNRVRLRFQDHYDYPYFKLVIDRG